MPGSHFLVFLDLYFFTLPTEVVPILIFVFSAILILSSQVVSGKRIWPNFSDQSTIQPRALHQFLDSDWSGYLSCTLGGHFVSLYFPDYWNSLLMISNPTFLVDIWLFVCHIHTSTFWWPSSGGPEALQHSPVPAPLIAPHPCRQLPKWAQPAHFRSQSQQEGFFWVAES